MQGLCLPFRGFSRSGATISCGLLAGASKQYAEEFSFALAVILTPPVLIREIMRLAKSQQDLVLAGFHKAAGMFFPSLFGLICSFTAGFVALRWLTRWLERGRWHYFGYYCLFVSVVVLILYAFGY
jgi:undecaprenyl-diphosphatase